MNLAGMTQLQVEELFSQEGMRKQFKVELEEFMKQNMKQEYYLTLHKALDNGNDKKHTFNVMLELIAKLGNPKLGAWIGDIRVVEINHLISIIAGLKSMTDRFDNQYRYLYAINIVEEMDTILFDVNQKKVNIDGQWTTETSAHIGFTVGEGAIKLEGLNRYRFPLIEKPIDWEGSVRGGYHDPEQRHKVTSNKGYSQQPQQVLDVLNILQGNKYRLRDIDMNEEYQSSYETMMKRAVTDEQKSQVPLNVETKLLTCWETYNAMNELDFYFAWQFDFRGRMYSNGYDINLQADKFKKGALQPIMMSSMRRQQLERELNECK